MLWPDYILRYLGRGKSLSGSIRKYEKFLIFVWFENVKVVMLEKNKNPLIDKDTC